jgi:hypothetical protein
MSSKLWLKESVVLLCLHLLRVEENGRRETVEKDGMGGRKGVCKGR